MTEILVEPSSVTEPDITVTVEVLADDTEAPTIIVVEPESAPVEVALVEAAISNASDTAALQAQVDALTAELAAVRATAETAEILASEALEEPEESEPVVDVYVPPAEPVDDTDEQEPQYVHWWHRPLWGSK